MSARLVENARELKLPWRDTVISLDAWEDDDFGWFDYTSQNGRVFVQCELRPEANGIAITLHTLNDAAPADGLPGTNRLEGEVTLVPADNCRPHTVPAAILLLIVWAEWVSHLTPERP